jgi:hypothetical protein
MKRAESIAEYIVWLMKKYHEIKQVHQDAAYKVINIENTDKNTILTIQISAKNTVFKATPQEIIEQDNFLESFSKKDIRLISYLAFNAKPKKARIVMQEFCEPIRKNIFSILHPDEEKILKLTAGEITVDKKVLNSLVPDDALMVGYLLADESFSTEKVATKDSS